MRVLMFGPPGAGKGTQANLLVSRFELRHISTGNMLREVIEAGTEIGKIAKEYIDQGKLVPNQMIRVLAEEAIAQSDYDHFILDGYPRTVEQAEWLKEYMIAHNIDLNVIASLKVPDEVIVGRLSKRRVHKITGENYHLDYKPPPADIDPALIIQRQDDRAEAVRKRLVIYHEQTKPVEDYYVNHPHYVCIDGTQPMETVHEIIGERLLLGEDPQTPVSSDQKSP